MDGFIINVGPAEFIGIIVTITGSLVAIAWKVSGRLARVETLVEAVKNGFEDMRKGFEKTIDNLKVDVDNVKYGAFEHESPIQLTPKGWDLLNKSGLREYIDSQQDKFLDVCKKNFKLDTAYDIQEAVFDYFDKLEIDPEYEKRIKEYAYKDGASMEIVRRVGAIYFRDICLKHFNKDATELDKHPVAASTSPN